MVTGSRDWTDVDSIRAAVVAAELHLWVNWDDHDTVTLISGGARGADQMAEEYARQNDWSIEQHLPDWEAHGKRAGILRNVEMLDSGVDLVIAFHKNASRGTAHAIDEARKRGITTRIWSEP